jgi:hypothetical protein
MDLVQIRIMKNQTQVLIHHKTEKQLYSVAPRKRNSVEMLCSWHDLNGTQEIE